MAVLLLCSADVPWFRARRRAAADAAGDDGRSAAGAVRAGLGDGRGEAGAGAAGAVLAAAAALRGGETPHALEFTHCVTQSCGC